jgi:hypothetical protein
MDVVNYKKIQDAYLSIYEEDRYEIFGGRRYLVRPDGTLTFPKDNRTIPTPQELSSSRNTSPPPLRPSSASSAAATSSAASPSTQTVAASGGKGGQVTVGRAYPATQGGVQGNVTYNAQGQKTFTPNQSSTAPNRPEGPLWDMGGDATKPTTSSTATATATPTKPSNPLMANMPGQNKAELEKLRGMAALATIARSPNGSNTLVNPKSQIAKDIVSQSYNRVLTGSPTGSTPTSTAPTSSTTKMKTFKEFCGEATRLDKEMKNLSKTVKNPDENLFKKVDAVRRMGEIEKRLGVSSLVPPA